MLGQAHPGYGLGFATGDGKHSPLPWRRTQSGADINSKMRPTTADARGPLVSAVVAPAERLLRGAPTFEDLRVTRRGK